MLYLSLPRGLEPAMWTYMLGLLFLGSTAAAADFTGFHVFQAMPENEQGKQLLKEMNNYYPEDVVDFWSYTTENNVEFLVDGKLCEEVRQLLRNANITYKVMTDNYQENIDQERREILAAEADCTFS